MKKYAIKIGILYVCISIVYLFICNGVSNSNMTDSKIINHELRLTKDGAGDYMITSVPQELYDSEEFNFLSRAGMISAILTCREDGKWDSQFFILSRHPDSSLLIRNGIERLQLFMDICDKAIPDEKMIGPCYYADYNELIIYLHPDLWKNKAHYEEVIKKLNDGMLGETV